MAISCRRHTISVIGCSDTISKSDEGAELSVSTDISAQSVTELCSDTIPPDCVIINTAGITQNTNDTVHKIRKHHPQVSIVITNECREKSQVSRSALTDVSAVIPQSRWETEPAEALTHLANTLNVPTEGSQVPDVVVSQITEPACVFDYRTGSILASNEKFASFIRHDQSFIQHTSLDSFLSEQITFDELTDSLTQYSEDEESCRRHLPLKTSDEQIGWLHAEINSIEGVTDGAILRGRELKIQQTKEDSPPTVVSQFDLPAAVHHPDTGSVLNFNAQLRSVLNPLADESEMVCDDNAAIESLQRLAMEAGSEWKPCFEEWCIQTGETSRWFVTHAWPGTTNGTQCIFTVSREITRQKQRESELQRVKRRFDLVTQNIDEVIYIANYDFSEVEFISPAYEDMWGEPVEELYANETSFISAIDERDKSQVQQKVATMREEIKSGVADESYTFEFRLQNADADDSVRWIHAVGYPVETAVGENKYVGIAEDITERKKLEQSNRELFENVSDGLVVHDLKTGEMLDVNQRFCEMTGYSKQELISESVEKVSSDQQECSQALSHLTQLEHDEQLLIEWMNQTKNGEEYPVEVHLSRVTLNGDERVLASVRDISDRKETERRLETIVERIDDGVVLADQDSDTPAYISPKLQKLTGFDTEQLSGPGSLEERVPTESREQFRQEYKMMMEYMSASGEKEKHSFEFQFNHPTRGRRVLELTGYPLDESYDSYDHVCVLSDITSKKEQQARIEQSERTYREIFNSVKAGITVHDPDSKELVGVNDPMCELLGYDRETILQKDVNGITANTSEYSKKRGAEIIDRVAESNTTEEFEWVVKDSSGEAHIMLVNATLATIDGSDRVLATSQEITARRKREAVMENLQGAIDKMQAAENVEEIYRIVEKTAEEVLQLPRTACWGYDESEERLQCVSQTESGEFGPDILPPESPEYTAFQAGNTLEYSPAENHQEASVQTAILTPIRDYGVLAAGQCQSGDYEPYLTDAAQVLTAHAAVALDRIHRGKRLKESETRLQAIINRIDEAILLLPVSKLNQPRPEPDYVSSGYDDLLGTPLGTIHEVFDEGFFGALHPDDYDSYCRFIESIQADVQAGEVDQRYIRTYRIRLHDGTTKWIRSEYYPTSWLEGEPRIVIVSRDITERKAREETIESFHDITAKLTTTETVHEAGNIAVNAAASVFDIPTTAVYTYQEGSGELSLISTGPNMNADRIPDTLTADIQPVWETFIGESMQIESVEATPVLQTGSYQYVFMLPLGTNGVLIIWGKQSSFDTEAGSILAATLEASLNRLYGEQQLESHREELNQQTERAQRLDSIAELTHRVEAAITRESTRKGIQKAVCNELTSVDQFAGAMTATGEVGTNRLTTETVVGIESRLVNQSLSAPEKTQKASHPAIKAWQSNEACVAEDILRGVTGEWATDIRRAGIAAVCSVPIVYNEIRYGVLTVFSERPDAFNRRETEILSQLGKSVGYAITAIERQRALEADNTIELEFHASEMQLPVAQLADKLKTDVAHERTIRRKEGVVSVYYRIFDPPPVSDVEECCSSLPGSYDILSEQTETCDIEHRVDSWIGSLVSEYGGILRRCYAAENDVEIVIELPQETDTRSIVNRIQGEYPALKLTAKRQHRQTVDTIRHTQDAITDELSERQYEVLQTAYSMGYFEWPRANSGEEVATQLGITQPTVSKHLRLGQQGLFEILFGSTETEEEY